MTVPELGDLVPQRGNAVSKAIARFLYRLFGWRFEGAIPNIPRCVFIGAPHTSNWDFPLALLMIFSLGLRLSWLGKHTFVDGPFKPVLHWLGGVPVDRRAPQGLVAQIIEEFNQREQLFLGISPEGTRSMVQQWKTGFYRIAEGANVPILSFTLDYGRKVIKFGNLFWVTGDIEADMVKLKGYFDGVVGKNPDNYGS
ncbi:MAG: lysophospholipid acyltransferase family protein [Chloroflexota bacterium]|nr:lysophospholipid acyltransferase family protein [Anaerolineales bacterium]MCB8968417.1 lysophospholipid acyltransferase family protein [Ardenticatenaceae bacterium]